MTELDYLQAILLGVIQGLTEFLPISSSGHLAITQARLGLNPDSPTMLLLDVMMHVGTLLAVLLVFARPGKLFLSRLLAESTGGWHRPRYAWRIALLAIVASIPTAAIGLAFKDTFEAAFGKPEWIGVGLMVTGVCLAALAVVRRGKRGWKDFTWWQATLVGIAQGLAIMPGVSRSGITIGVASYCGLRRRWSAEFSFLIAVPAIAGATLLKLGETYGQPAEVLRAVPWMPILVGSAVSLVVGVVALLLLLGAVRRAKLHYFALYCWAIGVALLLKLI